MKQTKKSQLEAVRAILYSYKAGQQVDNVEHIEHLLDVFTRHPSWDIKQGSGVDSIWVDKSGYNNNCFFIRRTDGSLTDISFTQCINGKSSKLSDVRAACRSAIRPEIEAYRTANVVYGETICPITGEVLTQANTHIDHYDKPFQAVFEGWMESIKMSAEFLFLHLNSTATDLETKIYFDNKVIEADFVDYHNANTHLRAVSKQANLSTLKTK